MLALPLSNFTPEQDAFLACNRFSDVEARQDLFAGITHSDYLKRRRDLKANGYPVADVRNRPRVERSIPTITIPQSFQEERGARLWHAVTQFQENQRVDIENQLLTDARIEIDTDRPFGVVFMSDLHIGGLGTDHEAIMRDVEIINSCDQLVAYVGGDPTDNFITDKLAHAARETQAVKPGYQWEMFRHMILELRPSLLAVGRGNHDAWTSRQAGIDGVTAALEGIPILHTAEDTYVDLRVGEQEYVIYRKHRPIGNSRTHRAAGAKASYNYGVRLFDVGVTEHHHEASLTCEKRHDQYRWFITTGSYKVNDPHAREWGYYNGGIGTPVVIFYPYRRKMIAYMSIEDAVEHLER
jgi:hypothetical protein